LALFYLVPIILDIFWGLWVRSSNCMSFQKLTTHDLISHDLTTHRIQQSLKINTKKFH